MTKEQVLAVLDKVGSWPEQDREELAEFAREIEARRKGVYQLTPDEEAALDRALASPIASEEEVKAVWKECGVERLSGIASKRLAISWTSAAICTNEIHRAR